MIFRTSELLNRYKNIPCINNLVAAKKLFKVGYGLYSDLDISENSLEVICARYPKAIVSSYSAFAFYDISDYVPTFCYFATPDNSIPIDNSIVKQQYIDKKIINIGVKEVKTDYGMIRIYDEERMLIELFRSKNSFSQDYRKDIIKHYRILATMGVLDTIKIMKYCKQFKNGESILRQIKEVVL